MSKIEINKPIKIIFCDTCSTVIANDYGNRLDPIIIGTLVNGHINTPTIGTPSIKQHEFSTVDLKTQTSEPGIQLDKNFTD
jgi:hypothetical protein